MVELVRLAFGAGFAFGVVATVVEFTWGMTSFWLIAIWDGLTLGLALMSELTLTPCFLEMLLNVSPAFTV